MHLLLLDESGKIDQGGLFALGGIAVRDTDWPRLRRDLLVRRSSGRMSVHVPRGRIPLASHSRNLVTFGVLSPGIRAAPDRQR